MPQKRSRPKQNRLIYGVFYQIYGVFSNRDRNEKATITSHVFKAAMKKRGGFLSYLNRHSDTRVAIKKSGKINLTPLRGARSDLSIIKGGIPPVHSKGGAQYIFSVKSIFSVTLQ